VAIELIPDADAEAGPALTAAGLAAGTLLYVGADAWLSRNESRQMRRAMQAAASGRPMSDAMAAAESASGPDHRRRALARPRVAADDRHRAGSGTCDDAGRHRAGRRVGELVSTAQAIAAGAVLAVVTIAVVPHAFEEVSRLVATVTVAGFACGYLLS
jgi:hypothetical protein